MTMRTRSRIFPKPCFSKSKHVAGFYEELAAVVEEAVASVSHESGETRAGAHYIEVLQIAVIADINRGARMHQVSDEEVGVELALCREVRVGRSDARCAGEERVVLQNQAERKLRSELPVPLAANDVIVQDAATDSWKLGPFEGESLVRRPQALE